MAELIHARVTQQVDLETERLEVLTWQAIRTKEI
jgi:hypothetical protein